MKTISKAISIILSAILVQVLILSTMVSFAATNVSVPSTISVRGNNGSTRTLKYNTSGKTLTINDLEPDAAHEIGLDFFFLNANNNELLVSYFSDVPAFVFSDMVKKRKITKIVENDYVKNGSGNSKTLAMKTTYSFTVSNGKVTRMSKKEANQIPPKRTANSTYLFTYDSKGVISSARIGTSQWTFSKNSKGNINNIKMSGMNDSVRISYNSKGFISAIKWFGSNTSSKVDAKGRLTAVATHTFSYNTSNRFSTITNKSLGNSMTAKYKTI